jgi:hypothetical protein
MDENDGRDGMEQETNKLLRDPELAEPIQGRAKELGWVCRRLIMWWNFIQRDVAVPEERSAI